MNDIIEQRRAEFQEDYDHAEAFEVRRVIEDIFDMIEIVFDSETAGELMLSAYRKYIGEPELENTHYSDRHHHMAVYDLWRELDLDDLFKVPLVRFMESLNGYAFFGLPVHQYELHENLFEAIHGAWLVAIEEVMRIPNIDELPATKATIGAAETRHFFVDGLGQTETTSVHIEGLAELAGVSVKTLRNMLAPSGGEGIHVGKDGRIPAAEARQWLEGRRNFRPSVWQLVEASDSDGADAEIPDPAMDEEIFFVPASKDGSVFSPDAERDGAYTVGAKGQEERIENYREALARLQVLDRPSWRRPTESGRWGLVTATHWLRKTASELDLEKEVS